MSADTKDLSEKTLAEATSKIAAAAKASGKSLSQEAPAKENAEKVSKGASKTAGQARKRIPLGTRNILTASKRPGYARRFVNDKGDRIQAFKDAGWTAVETDEQVGDDKAGRATSVGSSANPSVGGGQRAVLMEIPEEFHDEDNKSKQAKITQVENEIRRNSSTPGQDGLDGKVSIS